jgi:hypothetical protein
VIAIPNILILFLINFFNEAEDRSVRDRWKKPFLGLSTHFLNSETGHIWRQDRHWVWKTLLIGLTDGEHLFQSCKKWCIIALVTMLSVQIVEAEYYLILGFEIAVWKVLLIQAYVGINLFNLPKELILKDWQ